MPTPSPKAKPASPPETKTSTAILTDEGLKQLISVSDNAGPVFAKNASESILRAMEAKADQGSLCDSHFYVRERIFTRGSDGKENYVSGEEQTWPRDETTILGNHMAVHLPSSKLHISCFGNRECRIYFQPCGPYSSQKV